MNLLQLAQKISAGTPASPEDIAWLNGQLGGFEALIGLQYEICEQDRVRARLPIGQQLMQPWGIVHGGVHAAVAESVGSLAAVCATGQTVVGMSNHTELLRPATEGTIIYEARVVHAGKKAQAMNITAWDERDPDRLIATGLLRTLAL
ncbi:MAG: PaaI family thioesterase [Corynebacterium sp.]|nr:PaaI family thioesterase [Corynebacterium sp.]